MPTRDGLLEPHAMAGQLAAAGPPAAAVRALLARGHKAPLVPDGREPPATAAQANLARLGVRPAALARPAAPGGQ
jgi:hypothetical protein